jgi:hypothetical protein
LVVFCIQANAEMVPMRPSCYCELHMQPCRSALIKIKHPTLK